MKGSETPVIVPEESLDVDFGIEPACPHENYDASQARIDNAPTIDTTRPCLVLTDDARRCSDPSVPRVFAPPRPSHRTLNPVLGVKKTKDDAEPEPVPESKPEPEPEPEPEPGANPEPETKQDSKCLRPEDIVRILSASQHYHNTCFEVRPSLVAGLGAFASRDLFNGDVILRESPLFISDSSNLYKDFGNLDEQAKDVVLSLHANDQIKPGTNRVKAVWSTNCFATGPSQAGLFVIAARFNHRCHPAQNIRYEFDRENNCLVLTVRVATVAAGQELTISYGPSRTPEMLFHLYGFRCDCGSCSGLSDEYIAAINDPW